MKNYYKILGVSKTSKKEDILDAYLKLLKKLREKSDKTLVNRNNIILITEAFNVLSNSTKKNKYDKEYKKYLDNKDEIDKKEKEDRVKRREERETKRKEEEEAKKEAEKTKKEEEEAKKEAEKTKKEETKKKEEKETKNKKNTSSNKGQDESKNKKSRVDFNFNKIQDLIKSPNFSFFLSGVLITILIIVILSKCSSDDDFKDFDGVGKSPASTDQFVSPPVEEPPVEEPPVEEPPVEDSSQEDQPDEEPTYPRRGTLKNYYCDGTTQVRRIHNGRGGWYFSRIENSEICGYKTPPKFERYGKLHKSECQGTSLVNIYHDGKGGFYARTSVEKAIRCGYKEPNKNWRLKVNVYNKKGRLLAVRDNVEVYVLKTASRSSRIGNSYYPYGPIIDLSKHPGAKYILVKGSRRNKSCDIIKPIGNNRSLTFYCNEF